MATGKTRAGSRAGPQRGTRVAIVRARWNEEVTLALERGAIERASAAGASVDLFQVAGSLSSPQPWHCSPTRVGLTPSFRSAV